MESISLKWDEGMSFVADVNGHKIAVDSSSEHGGTNKGPRPKPLILTALAGCSAMDVVSILAKMRVPLEDFNVIVNAEMTDVHPKVYSKIHIIYEFWGKDLPMDKLLKAVNLSQDQYCGVSAMLRKAADITFEIKTY